MMGSFLTRSLVMVLGYAYPAYECYKTVEMNNPGIEQLRFWCQYWILVALLTVFERVGDAFISWLPMYSEAKLAFFVYLWYPKTKGTTFVYDSFFRPYVSKHETEIDRSLLELRTRAGDILMLYWQKAASYGQTRFFEILQYVVYQSQSSRTGPVQQQQIHQAPHAVPTRHPPISQPPPSCPTRSAQLEEAATKAGGVAPPTTQPQTTVGATSCPSSEAARPPIATKEEAMQADAPNTSTNQDPDPPAQRAAMEEAVRVTRARWRRRGR